jgi:hypothetical protein
MSVRLAGLTARCACLNGRLLDLKALVLLSQRTRAKRPIVVVDALNRAISWIGACLLQQLTRRRPRRRR